MSTKSSYAELFCMLIIIGAGSEGEAGYPAHLSKY